jgi:hypothetical protein
MMTRRNWSERKNAASSSFCVHQLADSLDPFARWSIGPKRSAEDHAEETRERTRLENPLAVLLLLLLVPQLYAPGHLVEGLAVVQLQFRPPAEEVLQLRDERDLRLHPYVEASQLLVQLQPYICKNNSLPLEFAEASQEMNPGESGRGSRSSIMRSQGTILES